MRRPLRGDKCGKRLGMDLVLGFRGVRDAEISLVRAIVRLSSMLEGKWTVSDSDVCDLLLAEWPVGTDDLPAATTVVPVMPVGHGASAGALRRPIRAEELISVLNAEVARRKAQPAAPDVTASQPASAPIARDAQLSARLTRWPAWDMLKDDRSSVRMATLLSRASLTADRLSELSGVPREACVAFMNHLEAHQLLTWLPTSGAVTPVVQRATPRAAGAGLLHSLRRKLGILLT